MKKLLLLAVVSIFTFAFTGCNKEEDPPAPEQVVTPVVPVATTSTNNYVIGSGWSSNDVHLTVEKIANPNVTIFANNLSTNSVFTIDLDRNYHFRVQCNPIGVDLTGLYSISSSGVLTFSEDLNGNVINMTKETNGNITISKNP